MLHIRRHTAKKSKSRVALLVLPVGLLAVALGLSACGSSGGSEKAAANSSHHGKSLRFIYISNNPSSSPNGAIIKNGFDAGGEELGVSVEYRSTKSVEFTPTEVKQLIEDAIAAKPDGLVISDPDPSALNATIKSAVSAGIPVVLSQTGLGQAKAVGALTYVGNNEQATGELGGKTLSEAGATHALMVSIPPGVPFVEEREAGFKKGFSGGVTTLAVKNFSDITATTDAIIARLQKEPDINGVFSLGSALSPAELAAERQLGGGAKRIKWSTIDLGAEVLEAIQNGSFSFALDQQPYLEGYLPVLYLKQYIDLGITPVQPNTPTGPAAVTAQNAGLVLKLSHEKLR